MSNIGFSMSDLGLAMNTYTGTKLGQNISNGVDGAELIAVKAVDALNQLLTLEMQDLISNGIDKVYESVGLTESNIAFAKTILGTVNSSIAKIQSIISIIPSDVTSIPSAFPITGQIASMKDMALTTYYSMQYLFNASANALTSLFALPTELLVAIMFKAIEEIEKMVDVLVYKYTGYHILEIYNLCTEAILLINTLRMLKKSKSSGNSSSDGSGLIGSNTDINVSVDISIDDNKIKDEQEVIVKLKLFDYMKSVSTPLYNAFMMLQIKETAMLIKIIGQLVCNINISKLSADITCIEDIINILDEMLGANPTYISLSDIEALGLNNMLAAASLLKTAVDNATNYNQFIPDNMNTTLLANTALSNVTVNVNVAKTYTIEASENDPNSTFNFNMIVYVNPNTFIKKITKHLKNIKDGKELVIPNIEIARFIKELQVLWDTETNNTIAIQGLVEGLTRKYIFHVTNIIDKSNQESSNVITDAVITPTLDINEVLGDLILDTPEIVINEEDKDNKMIFDIIGILLKTIKPLISTLKQLAILIENYKINKAKTQAHARGLLKISLQEVMETTGLMKILDKAANSTSSGSNSENIELNFYTVRTRRLNEYLLDKGYKPNELGITNISLDATNELITDCSTFIDITSLNTNAPTILYFDSESINEDTRIYNNALLGIKSTRNGQLYKDGTTNGLDSIEIGIGGEIYISKSGRSTLTSEIHRAIKRNYDPRQ